VSGGWGNGMPMSDIAALIVTLERIESRLDVLERPSGEQLATAVAELTSLVSDLNARIDDYIANDAYTKAQVDALVASPGNIAPGNVSASGNVTGANVSTSGTVTGSAGIKSTGAYNQLVTYGGSYRALWVHVDGTFGYAPSSAEFKADVKPLRVTAEDVLKLQAVTYRYTPRAPYAWGCEELGGIAQEVEAAGFPWLVDRDEHGEPFGLRNDLLAWVLLEGFRDLFERTLGARP
jgi:hypothetical protein